MVTESLTYATERQRDICVRGEGGGKCCNGFLYDFVLYYELCYTVVMNRVINLV